MEYEIETYLECKDEIARQANFKSWTDLYGQIKNVEEGLVHELLAKSFHKWVCEQGEKYYFYKKWHINGTIEYLTTTELFSIYQQEKKS